MSGHGHAHAPEPMLADGAPLGQRAPLGRGSGHDKLLFLDAFSGLAGDMIIAALLDLGVPLSVVEEVIPALGLVGVRLVSEAVRVGAIGARRFSVSVEQAQPERTYREIDQMIERAPLDPRVQTLSRRVFHRLAQAEAQVHAVPLESVHFHEVGAVDSIVDVVGAAACCVYLGAEVVVSPLPLGHGHVHSRHGWLPLPAPATVVCLIGVPTYDAAIAAELVTPTGAALAATVAGRFCRWPSMRPESVGWGAGTTELDDRPNALRVVLGTPTEAEVPDPADHVVLEANLDDFTGELAAHAIALLLGRGALDAWVVPSTTKKGRPGMVLSALARREQLRELAELILRETSSLGVRHHFVSRFERPRSTRMVHTRYGDLPVKSSGGPYGPVHDKPEFDRCVEAARLYEVPVQEVLAEVMRVARETGSGNDR